MDVLPRIPKGVLVMVHDVHMPVAVQPVNRDSKVFILSVFCCFFLLFFRSKWNEEFALNLFLMYNVQWKVRWPGNHVVCCVILIDEYVYNRALHVELSFGSVEGQFRR